MFFADQETGGRSADIIKKIRSKKYSYINYLADHFDKVIGSLTKAPSCAQFREWTDLLCIRDWGKEKGLAVVDTVKPFFDRAPW
jgi:hypothetical protein